MSLKTSCALGHVDITSSVHKFLWFFMILHSMYLWPAFWHTVKTKISFNGTIYSIKTAELTRLRNQATVNNTVVTFSPFSPISPFSPRGPGKPYKNKMDKDRPTFIHTQGKISNTLGEHKMMISLHALYVYVCYVCTHACAQEHVRQVSHSVW